jgi:hypothetical protein
MGEKTMKRMLRDWGDEPWVYTTFLLSALVIGFLTNLF